MIEMYALVAVALLAAGAVAGFVAVVSLGIRREEADRTMTLATSDRIVSGARVANGVHSLRPAVIHEAAYYRRDRRDRPDRPPGEDQEW